MVKIISVLMSILLTVLSFLGIPADSIYALRAVDKDVLAKNISDRAAGDIAEEKLIGLEAIVYQDNECVFSGTFGKDSVNGKALKANSLYRIASMTKPITAAAVLLEVEKGNIDLFADVADYIPSFRDMDIGKVENGEIVITGKANKSMKVYQLLSHCAGMVSGEAENAYYSMIMKERPDFDRAYAVERMAQLPLAYEPSESQAYSSMAFDIAARIVEITSGQTFESYIKKNIFDKLGMKDTTFTPTAKQWNRMVAVHNRTEEGKAFDQPMPNKNVFGGFPAEYYMAGGGLASTAGDYIKFAQMLLNKGKAEDGTQVLSESSVALMKTPMVSSSVMPGDARWGLGVIVYVTDRGRLPRGSFGWSGAYGTHFFVDPADRITAVYMKNSAYEGGAGCRTANNFEEDVMGALTYKLA